jgi:hypothetical protein
MSWESVALVGVCITVLVTLAMLSSVFGSLQRWVNATEVRLSQVERELRFIYEDCAASRRRLTELEMAEERREQ